MASTTYSPVRTKDYLSLVNSFPENVPVTVMHMLRFNPTAIYPPSSPHATLPPISGRDAFYQRYIPAGTAAAQEVGIKAGESRFFSTRVTNLLIHNDVPWDVVAVRTYASFAEYAGYQASKEYQENAVPHRNAALMDWSLVACVEDEYPPRT
ncbi:Fc.00g114210.m01.CDS01 [Cosmosporella sp. VM-42]